MTGSRATHARDAGVHRFPVSVKGVVIRRAETREREAMLSDEHKRVGWFPLSEVAALPMPAGYKASIRAWADLVARG